MLARRVRCDGATAAFTVGLIWAASMVVLNASRRNQRVPRLALSSLGTGIVATVGANLAHGLGHCAIGALVSAWPASALVGSFQLLMLLIRSGHRANAQYLKDVASTPGPVLAQGKSPAVPQTFSLEEAVRAWYSAGHSQRAIACELNIDRRKVKLIFERGAAKTGRQDG